MEERQRGDLLHKERLNGVWLEFFHLGWPMVRIEVYENCILLKYFWRRKVLWYSEITDMERWGRWWRSIVISYEKDQLLHLYAIMLLSWRPGRLWRVIHWAWESHRQMG